MASDDGSRNPRPLQPVNIPFPNSRPSQPINIPHPDSRSPQPPVPRPPQYVPVDAKASVDSFARPDLHHPQPQTDLHRFPPPPGPPNGPPPPQRSPQDPRARTIPNVRPDVSPPASATFASPAPPPPPPQSNAAPPQGQPVNDAVTSAFSRADTAVPPELIAQITEDVIKRLRAAGVDGPAANPAAAAAAAATAPPPPPPPAASGSSHGHSRNNSQTTSDSASVPARDVYTPPSPRPNKPDIAAYGSPPRQGSVIGNAAIPSVIPNSPRQPTSPWEAPKGRSADRGPPSPEHSETSRPGPERKPTDQDETPMDRTWGQLFDESGHSTARLGQFLRGLANHIIEDFEPTHSIVVTPVKMARYYELCRLTNETWPWKAIFRDLTSTKLSRLYQDLECQHHLVQDRENSVPTIPGLTAIGFATWMTTMILARPDEEVERLQKAVMEMPISNADDQKERFPKEISRRLFPKTEDRQAGDKIKRAFPAEARSIPPAGGRNDHARSDNIKPPPPGATADRQHYANYAPDPRDYPQRSQTKIERERAPYCGSPSESAIDDRPLPPGGIERERKPYSGARRFDAPPDLKPNPSAAAGRAGSTGRPRTQSTSSRVADFALGDDGMRHGRAGSIANGPPRGRRRSPTLSEGGGGGYRRQEADVLGYPEPGGPVDIGMDPRRYGREPDLNNSGRSVPDWDRRNNDGSPSRRFDNPRDRERDRERYGRPPAGGGMDDGFSRHPRRGSGTGYDFEAGGGGVGGGVYSGSLR